MAARIDDCTGVLLAGGRAERLGGIPKGLLQVDGEPIAVRALALFRALFGEALLVTSTPGPYATLGVVAVPDLLPGRGAPGGLHAALTAVRTGWVFAAACDMPFLSEAPIRLLAARRAGALAVLVRRRGRLEPLHAFWSRGCLPALERLLAEGQPSLRALAASVPAQVVEEADFRAADPEGRALENVNTPEDAARLGLALGPGAGPGAG
jgi:molybdopterin-guanine dinucleotide biosynthesis protein A